MAKIEVWVDMLDNIKECVSKWQRLYDLSAYFVLFKEPSHPHSVMIKLWF